VDADLGLVYLPVETPHLTFMAGIGREQLFVERLVCCGLRTGSEVAFPIGTHPHMETLDISSAPILDRHHRDGRRGIKAVAVPSKQDSYTFLIA